MADFTGSSDFPGAADNFDTTKDVADHIGQDLVDVRAAVNAVEDTLLGVIDGTYTLERDYGLTDPSDAGDALQDAVDDILTVQGGGRLLLKDETYDFDAITWPEVGHDKPPPVIEIVGPFGFPTVGFMPGTGLTLAQGKDMPAPTKGAILRATLASGSAFGNIASTSNFVAVFRNVIVRVPTNPQWHGIDGGWLTNMVLRGVIVDQGRSWGDGSNPLSPGPIVEPTNTGVIGVVMPGEGNGGTSWARDLLVCGYYYGLQHSEHFDGDRITLAKNIVGHRPVDGWHASRIGRESLYWNKYGIKPTNFDGSHPIVPLSIQSLDTEEDPVGGNWYSTTYHVDDSTNLLKGTARFRRMIPAVGPSDVLLRNGGANFELLSLTTSALPWLANIPVFSRPNVLTQGTFLLAYDANSINTTLAYNNSNAQNDEWRWYVPLSAGTWQLSVPYRKGSDRAIQTWEISFDEGGTWTSIGTSDGYAASAANTTYLPSTFTAPRSGRALLRVKAATRNASASGWILTLSALSLVRTA